MKSGATDIRKNLQNIIGISIVLLLLVTVCWLYEPIVGCAISESAMSYIRVMFQMLFAYMWPQVVFIVLPAGIITNAVKILRLYSSYE